MKHAIKYGLYLGVILIFIEILYYFFHPTSMFSFFGKAMIFEIFLYAVFMFLAISKNKNTFEDSGTFFKIAFLTLAVGVFLSGIFEIVFSNYYSEELNPIFLEARKADDTIGYNLGGNDPLVTLEIVELMEETIEEELTLKNFLINNFVGLLFLGIPFTILVSYVSRRILKINRT